MDAVLYAANAGIVLESLTSGVRAPCFGSWQQIGCVMPELPRTSKDVKICDTLTNSCFVP